MYQSERHNRLTLLKERLRVAIDLIVTIGLLLGTLLFSLFTASAASSLTLHFLLSVLLNGSMLVFVGYFLLKRAGSW